MLNNNVSSESSKNSELSPLSEKYNLYLKPLARVSLTVQIPTLHDASGQTKSFTTWGIIEKLRQLCPGVLSPPTPIKVVRTTLEFVRFIAELETKSEVKRVVTSLDSQFIKLSGFPQNLRVRASEAQPDCPRRHDWESFFRDAADMDETKPGERPDTLVLSGLPVRWFSNSLSSSSVWNSGKSSQRTAEPANLDRPDPKMVKEVFEIFGEIRHVDIPMLDPVQNPSCVDDFLDELSGVKARTIENTSPNATATTLPGKEAPIASEEIGGFGKIGPDTISIVNKDAEALAKISNTILSSALGPLDSGDVGTSNRSHSVGSLTFLAYLQYKDYTGFTRAMEGLHAQKLVFAPVSGRQQSSETRETKLYFTAEIKMDFDRTKHLSKNAIQVRQTERNRLIALAQRRRAEAEAAAELEAREKRMLEAARRKAEERKRMEALAMEAEREAKRVARMERKKQRAIERCKQEKEALVRQKIMLDERRRLLAVRKLEAIRLVTFLVTRIQARHDAIVAAKREARLARAEREAAEAEALVKQAAAMATSFPQQSKKLILSQSPSKSECPQAPSSSTHRSISPNSESDASHPNDAEETRQRLLKKMLKRREEMLRTMLLKKHSELMGQQRPIARSLNGGTAVATGKHLPTRLSSQSHESKKALPTRR